MINKMILVLKFFVSHFGTEKFLAPLLKVYVFRSVIVLQESDQMLVISTLETNIIGGKALFPDQFKNYQLLITRLQETKRDLKHI